MKHLLLLLFVLLSYTGFTQAKAREYIPVSFVVPWKQATMLLLKGDTEIHSSRNDSSTVNIYQDLEPGFYKLVITGSAGDTEYRDSILVTRGQKITCNLSLDAQCPYNYPAGYIPVCPASHKNNIQEIRYSNDKNREKGKKYYLVNYTASGCIERYYCTKHDIWF